MALTKNTKPLAQYHTWLPAEFSVGDIIGIEESLGHPARNITIESLGGQSTIKINVSEKIFSTQTGFNTGYMMPDEAGFYRRPIEVTEVENSPDDILIEAEAVWQETTIPIRDIKVTLKSSGMKIIVS